MKQKISSLNFSRFSKLAGVILAISLLAASCGGSGGSASKQVVLNIWMTFENSQDLQPIFADYQAKHPLVQIVYTKKDVTTYESDLLNALASGNGPDVFSIHNSWLPKYLDKITPAPSAVWGFSDYKNTFVDAAVDSLTKHNLIYAAPIYVDSLALYYNKDLLGTAGIATPPKTWQELSADAQKLTKQDPSTGYFSRSGVAMGTNSNVNRGVDILYLLMLQAGVQPYSADGLTPTFAQSSTQNGNTANPGQLALTFYTSFANPSSPNYTWNANSDYSIDAFANGRAAFLYSYSYSRATIAQKSPNLNFDVAPVPQPDLNNSSVNFANFWGQAVNKQSKNAAVAWDFLKFITSNAELSKYYKTTNEPSARKDLIEAQIQDPNIGVFANANLTAKNFYRPDQTQIDNIFGAMIDNVVLKGFTVSNALNLGQQQAATITQQN